MPMITGESSAGRKNASRKNRQPRMRFWIRIAMASGSRHPDRDDENELEGVAERLHEARVAPHLTEVVEADPRRLREPVPLGHREPEGLHDRPEHQDPKQHQGRSQEEQCSGDAACAGHVVTRTRRIAEAGSERRRTVPVSSNLSPYFRAASMFAIAWATVCFPAKALAISGPQTAAISCGSSPCGWKEICLAFLRSRSIWRT